MTLLFSKGREAEKAMLYIKAKRQNVDPLFLFDGLKRFYVYIK